MCGDRPTFVSKATLPYEGAPEAGFGAKCEVLTIMIVDILDPAGQIVPVETEPLVKSSRPHSPGSAVPS